MRGKWRESSLNTGYGKGATHSCSRLCRIPHPDWSLAPYPASRIPHLQPAIQLLTTDSHPCIQTQLSPLFLLEVSNPDVAEPHRMRVILQSQRQPVRTRLVRR